MDKYMYLKSNQKTNTLGWLVLSASKVVISQGTALPLNGTTLTHLKQEEIEYSDHAL